MPCTEAQRRRQAIALVGGLGAWVWLAGCAQRPVTEPPRPTPLPAPTPSSAPAVPSAAAPVLPGASTASPAMTGQPAAAPRPSASPVPPATAGRAAPPQADRGPMPRQPRYVTLPPPSTPRNAAELRVQFAQRLVAAHPDGSYTGRAPDRLLAIPVLEVELNADGSVRGIQVLRRPSTGSEATALAIAAVRRAAPYGNVSRLPRPWKVVETFLFDDDLRFKPRTLDVD